MLQGGSGLLNIVIYIIIILGFSTELHNTTSHHQPLLINPGFFIACHKIIIYYAQTIRDQNEWNQKQFSPQTLLLFSTKHLFISFSTKPLNFEISKFDPEFQVLINFTTIAEEILKLFTIFSDYLMPTKIKYNS